MNGATREGGFTLVELMIGIFLLVSGLLALASGMATVTRYQVLSSARSEMMLLADSKLEQFRAAVGTATPDMTIGGSTVTPTAPHTDVVAGPSGRPYVRLWSIAAGPGSTRNVQLRIRPQVDSWDTPAEMAFATLFVPIL